MFIFIRREQSHFILRVESILRVYPEFHGDTEDANGNPIMVPAAVVVDFVDQDSLRIVEDCFRRTVELRYFLDEMMKALAEVCQSKGNVTYVIQDMPAKTADAAKTAKTEDPPGKVPVGQVRRPRG